MPLIAAGGLRLEAIGPQRPAIARSRP